MGFAATLRSINDFAGSWKASCEMNCPMLAGSGILAGHLQLSIIWSQESLIVKSIRLSGMRFPSPCRWIRLRAEIPIWPMSQKKAVTWLAVIGMACDIDFVRTELLAMREVFMYDQVHPHRLSPKHPLIISFFTHDHNCAHARIN